MFYAPGGAFYLYTNNAGSNGAAGRSAWSWNSSGYIYSANSSLNRYYTNDYSWADRRGVWAHEMGHVFGLGHTSQTGRIMYHCSRCSGVSTPQYDDLLGVNVLY